MNRILTLTALLLAPLAALNAADSKPFAAPRDDAARLRARGPLIFHDAFDREETGNGLKAIGNGWESATADRAPKTKQADLDGGITKRSPDILRRHSTSTKTPSPDGSAR